MAVLFVGGVAILVGPHAESPQPVRRPGPFVDEPLFDRYWYDRVPTTQEDVLGSYIFSHRGLGTYEHGSAWSGTYDHFQFVSEHDRIRIVFLQNRARHEVTYEIEAIGGDGFDLRLDIDGDPRGRGTYWGSSRQYIGSADRRSTAQVLHGWMPFEAR